MDEPKVKDQDHNQAWIHSMSESENSQSHSLIQTGQHKPLVTIV